MDLRFAGPSLFEIFFNLPPDAVTEFFLRRRGDKVESAAATFPSLRVCQVCQVRRPRP